MLMQHLALTGPVAQVLRSLFRVVSTLALSQQLVLPFVRARAEKWRGGKRKQVVMEDVDVWVAHAEAAAAGTRVYRIRETWTMLVQSVRSVAATSLVNNDGREGHAVPAEMPERQGDAREVDGTGAPSRGPAFPPSSSPSSSTPSPSPPPPSPAPRTPHNETAQPAEDTAARTLSPIEELLLHPLLYDPVRPPRNPIVLCHGLYGFDVRGPASFPRFQMHYWSNVLKVLKGKIGAQVLVTGVPGTGSIASRAAQLDTFLRANARGHALNFVAHSMGGLDCRHLIAHCRPDVYAPASLTTICTPHRGSPFMDWCVDNIGIGKLRHHSPYPSKHSAHNTSIPHTSDAPSPPSTSTGAAFALASLPSSFTTLLLSIIDSPAYSNLTTAYLEHVFNPATPDDPNVRYYSVAARAGPLSVWHPLWLPKMVLDGAEERERIRLDREGTEGDRGMLWGNDGLVTVRSARWGEFLGVLEGVDHWDLRGGRGLGGDWAVDAPGVVRSSLSDPLASLSGLAPASASAAAAGTTRDGASASAPEDSEGWSLRDWGRFVRAWRREEAREKSENASAARAHAHGEGGSRSVHGEGGSRGARRAQRQLESRQQRRESDAALRAATDRLSAVFDWIVEQVPTAVVRRKGEVAASAGADSNSGAGASREGSAKAVAEAARADAAFGNKDPRLKFDLERFYVALSRKLYDDGL